jgi:eukaryotic-like serine/threonine-protein kinase
VKLGRGAPPPSTEPPAARRRWPWIVGAVAVVLLLVAGAFALMSGDDPRTVPIPDVAGQTVQQATNTLERLGFEVSVRGQADENVERGRVIRSVPAAGTSAEEGSTVTLIVSGGPGLEEVPDVVGLESDAARAAIVSAGFEVDVIEQASDSVPQGRVISQNPAGNSEAERGSLVTLTISTGPEEVEVPNLNGLTEDEARSTLEAANLRLGGVSTRESDQVAPGRVIEQNPGRGALVATGSQVSVVLAIEPEPEPETITVPSVIGNFAADASAKLSALGFSVSRDTVPSSQPVGVVIAQAPSVGSEVARGSRVVITVSSGPGTPPEAPPEPATTEPASPAAPTTPADGQGPAQPPAPELP